MKDNENQKSVVSCRLYKEISEPWVLLNAYPPSRPYYQIKESREDRKAVSS